MVRMTKATPGLNEQRRRRLEKVEAFATRPDRLSLIETDITGQTSPREPADLFANFTARWWAGKQPPLPTR